MYLLLLLLWCSCIAVGCGTATTAALVHEETEETDVRENDNTEELQEKCRKQRKTGTVPQVIDGGGAQAGTSERPGRCQPSPLRKKI